MFALPQKQSDELGRAGGWLDGWAVERLVGCEVAGLGDWGPQIWVSTNE